MKLKKIEIENFRQYYGKQFLDFSIENEKSVTLIHGENNGGKTALLNALRWCLYEKTTENLLNPKELMNKHAISEGKNHFRVTVQLIHDNKLFEVRRTQSNSSSKSTLQLYEIKDGCYSERQENPVTLINTFLPEEMVEYFFYQGEGTGTLNSQNDFTHIDDAIRKVLGLTIAEKTLSHLKNIKSGYQKELLKYNTSDELSVALRDKEHLINTLEEKEAKLITVKNKVLPARMYYDEQVSKLNKFNKTAIEQDIRLRTEKEKGIESLTRNLNKLISNKKNNLNQWIKSSYSSGLRDVDISQINTEELKRTMRYSVDRNLINEILQKTECLCGAHLEEGSSARVLIDELSKVAVDPSLRERWKRATDLSNKLQSISSPRQDMSELLSDIDDNEQAISKLKSEIVELNLIIRDSNLENIKEIEDEKERANKEHIKLNNSAVQLEHDIIRTKRDINDLEHRISRLSNSMPMASKLNNTVNATEEIIKIYEDAIFSSKNNVDSILLKKMQDLFSRVAFNGYTVKKEKVNSARDSNSFVWQIVDDKGKKVAAGNGYQAMLAISFIVALIQFSKDRSSSQSHLLTPGTIGPFIADSILAFISPDNGRELVSYISDSVEQSIFMFSQAQWTEQNIDKGIRGKIGKEYNLVQHTSLSENEFKGAMPTKLSVHGKTYDVVRFNSDFDYVTIEEVVL